MKILRVAQKLYPDVLGGGPYHVHALSRDQAAMGHEVTVLTVRTDANRPAIERRDGYTVRRFPAVVSPLGNDLSPGLARFLATVSSRYDVVHAHSHLYASTVLAALAARRSATPIAITNHGLYSQSAPRAVFDAYLRTVGRLTFDAADTVFCYTDVDRRRLRDRGVTAPISVVPNGIDTTLFTPDGPGSASVDSTAPTILFVGRLVEGKRPRDLLPALAVIRAQVPDAQLVICGDGPLRAELEREAAARNVASAVRFLGTVPYDEMPSLYRDATVLALPSEAEGLPRTVLEALASGTPVVTSDLPQLDSVVTGVGRSVPVGDVSALAGAIGSLLTDDTSALSRRARTRVVEGYDWDETVRRTTDHLEHLATR